jgi:SpoVK/Ycf46/Vps4 family AAA+-type ATPase
MDNKFLKVGKSVNFKFTTDGLEYSLEPGTVYDVKIERYEGTISLEDSGTLILPNKVYITEKNRKLIDKVLQQYNNSETGFTGIMLSGLKGAGKTIIAKEIANESGLPIINLSNKLNPIYLVQLVKKLENVSVCFLFDELDKVYNEYDISSVLQVLDGTDTIGKHLIVFTCNEERKISEYLKDRCSRIRYWKELDELEPSMIQMILEDVLEDKKEVKSLTDFINEHFNVKSFDNVMAFVKEVNAFPLETFEDLFSDMNLIEK